MRNTKALPLLEAMLRKAGVEFDDISEVPLHLIRHVQRGAFPDMRMALVSERRVEEALRRPITRDLVCTRVGYQGPSPAHYIPRPEGSADCILIYCTAGRGWLQTGGTEFSITPGMAFFIPARQPHAYGAEDEDPWANYWVHFRGRQAQEYLDLLGITPRKPILYLGDSEEVVEALEQLYLHLQGVHNTVNLVAGSTALSYLLGTVLLQYRNPSRRGRTAEENCDKTIEFMHKNLKRPIDLKELARIAGMSPSHYGALFKRRHQYSPMQYLNRLRIQRSCQLLRHTDLRICEIAEEVGIPDAYYFSRLFRKIMGQSPSSYR